MLVPFAAGGIVGAAAALSLGAAGDVEEADGDSIGGGAGALSPPQPASAMPTTAAAAAYRTKPRRDRVLV